MLLLLFGTVTRSVPHLLPADPVLELAGGGFCALVVTDALAKVANPGPRSPSRSSFAVLRRRRSFRSSPPRRPRCASGEFLSPASPALRRRFPHGPTRPFGGTVSRDRSSLGAVLRAALLLPAFYFSASPSSDRLSTIRNRCLAITIIAAASSARCSRLCLRVPGSRSAPRTVPVHGTIPCCRRPPPRGFLLLSSSLRLPAAAEGPAAFYDPLACSLIARC